MRKKKLPPDTRPKWNDPDLPVTMGQFLVRSKDMQQFVTDRLHRGNLPNWRQDKTYDIRRRKSRI